MIAKCTEERKQKEQKLGHLVRTKNSPTLKSPMVAVNRTIRHDQTIRHHQSYRPTTLQLSQFQNSSHAMSTNKRTYLTFIAKTFTRNNYSEEKVFFPPKLIFRHFTFRLENFFELHLFIQAKDNDCGRLLDNPGCSQRLRISR